MILVLGIFLENEMVNPYFDSTFWHLLGFLYQKQSGFVTGFCCEKSESASNFINLT